MLEKRLCPEFDTDGCSAIDPQLHGIFDASELTIIDSQSTRRLLTVNLAKGQRLILPCFSLDPLHGYKYRFKFHQENNKRLSTTKYFTFAPVSPGIPNLLGRAERLPPFQELNFTRRQGITISPYRKNGNVSGGLCKGFIGVYEGELPVPEAIRLCMGAQVELMAPKEVAQLEIEERTIFAGLLHGGYGHFLTESLARLWIAKIHPEIPIVWLTSQSEFTDMQQRLLDVIGIKNRHIFLKRPTAFKEVIFPTPGVCIGDFFMKEHADFLGVVAPSPGIKGKRLFLSRSKLGAKAGATDADQALELVFEKHGFTSYHPELHPIEDQLHEISSSEVVAGIEGSAMHSLLLLRNPVKTRFVVIGRHRMGSGIFEHVRQAKGLNYQTLNVLIGNQRISSKSQISIDFDALNRIMTETHGLSDNLDKMRPCVASPDGTQRNYLDVAKRFKLALTRTETEVFHAMKTLKSADGADSLSRLGSLFPVIQV